MHYVGIGPADRLNRTARLSIRGPLHRVRSTHSHRNDVRPHRLTPMDRIFIAIIAVAVLVLIGASGLYITHTAELMHHARTVGVAGPSRQ